MITFFKKLLTQKAKDRETLLNTQEALYRAVKELTGYLKAKDEDENNILVCLSTQGEAQLAMLDDLKTFTDLQASMIENISKFFRLETKRVTAEMENPVINKPPTKYDGLF